MSSLAFFGTPQAAVPCLDAVFDHGDLVLVVTMPDRPRGRSRVPRPSPVKVRAQELGIEVVQPGSKAELAAAVVGVGPLALGVVVAYGMIVPPEVFHHPRHGLVNVHFSLLPRWRGAAPVERSILAGDEVTGVSLMQIEAGLDTGPVFDTWTTGIGPGETGGTLTERLSRGGAELLAARLPDLVQGRLQPVEQVEPEATYAPMLTTDEAHLDPAAPATDLARAVRAFNPRPGAFVLVGDSRLKIWKADAIAGTGEPGRLEFDGSQVQMGTGDGLLVLHEVQAAGRRAMSAAAWARGLSKPPGRAE